MKKHLFNRVLPVALLIMAAGCGNNEKKETGSEKSKLSGSITVDGSSTVYPITEAVAEEFKKSEGDVKVTVGLSGTGGGFKKFGRGEIDINDASRPVKSTEDSICKANNINYIELKVAFDGL